MSFFKDHYPRLMYKAADEHPGFTWQMVKDPGKAEALGPEWHDTPAAAIAHRAKAALEEKAGAALERAGAALEQAALKPADDPPADPAQQQQPAAEHTDAPAAGKGRRR